jgi:glycine hydroxymethyltransferase
MLANRNTVPGDAKPRTPSGIRIGTPSVTARGMREREMRRIGAFIYRTLRKRESPQRIKREVEKLALQFPLPYHHDR